MKERGLSKEEAFMMDTAAAAEVMKEQKHKKDKHKAAFGGLCLAPLWIVIQS